VPAHCPELGPCHVWTARTNSWGYGEFWFDGKHEKAHRVAFLLTNGRWPEPLGLHHCDNPPCCNQAHLFEGTHADNMRDRNAKGRAGLLPKGNSHWSRLHPERRARGDRSGARLYPERRPRGERHGNSKLTDQAVLDMRAEYARGGVTQKELAERSGMSRTQMSRILRGESWTHL
jgi:hypothetical protein